MAIYDFKIPNIASSRWLFKASPNDFEQNHYEGDIEIPAPVGGVGTTALNSPGTMASDGAVGDTAWANPDNAKVSNDTYATCTTTAPLGDVPEYLKATNFSFSVPTGATITGVELQIERKTDYNDEVRDYDVRLVVGGSIVGTNQSSQAWITTERIDTVGGSSNLWGTTLTPAQVNANDFGVVIGSEVYSGGGDNVLSSAN